MSRNILSVLFLLGLTACSGSDGDPKSNTDSFSSAQAKQAYEGFRAALGNGDPEAQGPFFEFPCREGGRFSITDEELAEFFDCIEGDLTLNGSIVFRVENQNQGDFVRQEVFNEGSIFFDGSLEGECEVNYSNWAEATSDSSTAGYTGTMCGQRIDLIVTSDS